MKTIPALADKAVGAEWGKTRFSMRAFFLVFALLPTFAFAEGDVDLFSVIKPVHAENVMVVQARTNGCNVQDLDFMWHMGVNPKTGVPQSQKRSQAESMIRKRFVISRTNPANAASCQKAVPKGTACNSFSVGVEEINWVNHGLKDPSVVIRADMAKGSCTVAAYIDAGTRVVPIKAINAVADNVVLKQILGMMTGATFRVRSLSIFPSDSSGALSFPCVQDCNKSEP